MVEKMRQKLCILHSHKCLLIVLDCLLLLFYNCSKFVDRGELVMVLNKVRQ